MLFLIFTLLSFLYALESVTSLARASGYIINLREAGFVLQSSLALFSRVAVFFMLPLIGFYADTNGSAGKSEILFNFALTIFWVPFIIFLFRRKIIYKFCGVAKSVVKSGSLINSLFASPVDFSGGRNFKISTLWKLKYFFFVFFLAYFPYYAAWPIVIIGMNEFPDYRATILGSASILNGINTILLALFIDPYLLKLARNRRIIPHIYEALISIRVIALFFVVILAIFQLFL
jgi:hypothetical protein